ncbi:class I SAM-dependent methyltransferase [Kiritimatiellaeota bacterium B1221]|nr:class I SAM-dependent methyltransferase [Kiritimatiellaeota bacterium B1221]
MSLFPPAWSPECWSLPYFFHRIRDVIYRKTHRNLPWLTPEANRILVSWIQPRHRILEFGSGKSTLFFAAKAAHVVSVEHQPEWADRVESWLRSEHLSEKATLIRCTPEQTALAAFTHHPQNYDLILIDGVDRLQCAINSLPHLKPGGWLVIDNINRHVPTQSKAPGSIRNWQQTPAGWRDLMAQLTPYEQYWTGNGITHTYLVKTH